MASIQVSDIKIIARNGGGMILDARKFQVSDLKIIASNASTHGASIQLNHVDHLQISDLKIIAGNSKGAVIFNFAEFNIA